MKSESNAHQMSCSFCNKPQDEVKKLIVSDTVSICNECVNLCQDLLHDEVEVTEPVQQDKMDPMKLKSYLDQYVIGQDRAKVVLSVAIINHYKRLQHPDKEITKANILMIGPTGSGKTLLAKTVARYLDVPFVIADATSLTEAGYVGDDVESMIARLYMASGNSVEKTQRGIVFVDEIDKISRKSESTSITRDVSGEGVQQALLKLVEGTVCRITAQGGRKHPGGEMVEIDTSNILFIVGGAFVGIDKIIHNRINGSSIGFGSPLSQSKETTLGMVSPDDLVRYGIIPEFVGRFPSVVTLDELSSEDLVKILTEVKNNFIDQYKSLFQIDEINLDIKRDAIDALVDRAITAKTGARALHSEIERVLMPHMFHVRDYRRRNIDTVSIDKDQVNNPAVYNMEES